jgi:tellurite resistance protein TehA-like permease
LGTPYARDITKIMSVMVGLWLWGLSLWFFLVSVGSLWPHVKPEATMPFRMTWWSFVFPNTALVTATSALGKVFDNQGLHIFGCFMAAALIIVWTFVFITMLRCLKNKELLWPRGE